MPHDYEQHLRDIYRQKKDTLQQIRQVISGQAEQIAGCFYQQMLADSEGIQFLNHNLVNERLHASMSKWLQSLFGPQDDQEIEKYIAWQREIGRIHARINIPMRLIARGMRVIKREINQQLRHADFSREVLADTLITVNELLDILIELLNHSYLVDSMEFERNAQSLRMDVVGNNLAIECERLRSSLFDWQRQVLFQVYRCGNQTAPLPDVRHSSFGLWVTHKAELLFPHDPIVSKITRHIALMDDQLAVLMRHAQAGDQAALHQDIETLNDLVTQASWLLSSLVEELLSTDTSRDPLTRLLNRRYLPVILQRETEISIKHNLSYAVLFVDIDHFKAINDTHGHDLGDKAIRHMAELLNTVLRSGDFIFRYGGEEFLIVLGDTNQHDAKQIAERLRVTVANSPFVGEQHTIALTCSIGVALHDGHPDYSQVIKRADQALYQAKSNGRNRVELA